ncbi:flippase-like domain-containing protein [Halovenus sp. WSH3]|uniref:Flippase-like domain-containing protein n=1 Tax=Halovenus carboxidivorans TaxID=2692199 RepID=A0A6B0T6G0_9EURY|nr:flippase-like domain-containing protein [Halovenus carboxidivorans]
MSRTSGRASIAAGFLAGAVALALFGWFVGPGQILAALSELRLGPYSLGFLAVSGALFAQYRGLLVLLDIPPASDSGLAYLRGVYARQLLPAGSVAGPVLIVYSMRRSTGLSTEEGLPAALISQAVSFLGLSLVALAGSVLLLGRGHRALLPVVGALALVCIAWVVVLGALVAGFGIDRTVAWIATALNRSLGRVSATVARATAREPVSEWLARFGDARRLIRESPGRIVAAVVWSIVAWVLLSAALVTTGAALGVAVPLGVACVVMPASDLLNVLPIPGGIGGVEVAITVLLVVFAGVEVATAAMTAFCVRLCTYWFVLLLGGVATTLVSTGIASD